ncbi:hypothetical protein LY76DRAFT_374663 [Colletotrichum caudatum]|nr:hypothetical protein LY76DRAFT_374663 [Colletotrichum caudatum]
MSHSLDTPFFLPSPYFLFHFRPFSFFHLESRVQVKDKIDTRSLFVLLQTPIGDVPACHYSLRVAVVDVDTWVVDCSLPTYYLARYVLGLVCRLLWLPCPVLASGGVVQRLGHVCGLASAFFFFFSCSFPRRPTFPLLTLPGHLHPRSRFLGPPVTSSRPRPQHTRTLTNTLLPLDTHLVEPSVRRHQLFSLYPTLPFPPALHTLECILHHSFSTLSCCFPFRPTLTGGASYSSLQPLTLIVYALPPLSSHRFRFCTSTRSIARERHKTSALHIDSTP